MDLSKVQNTSSHPGDMSEAALFMPLLMLLMEDYTHLY